MKELKTIAINLPQFHPIPENNEWWEPGFTEWTNVVKAKPQFPGHYQPHLPADLGFYDLRLNEARVAQAEMAAKYGISGFCYYHYWFNGKRLLHAPIDGILASGTPDFPFMLCWANENWSRRWDGSDSEILINQEYSKEDDINHINFLISNVFSDKRYIRVKGKPFFLVYRPQLFPDIKDTLKTWRKEAENAGLRGLYIGYTQSFGFSENPNDYGFDCAVGFEPDFHNFPAPKKPAFKDKIYHKLGINESVHYRHNVFSYKEYIEKAMRDVRMQENIFKSVMPNWDNCARRKKGAIIMVDSTPELYQKWLEHVINLTLTSSASEKFIFLNAWNEWAEGNHLEPCQKWGHRYLQATENALRKVIENL